MICSMHKIFPQIGNSLTFNFQTFSLSYFIKDFFSVDGANIWDIVIWNFFSGSPLSFMPYYELPTSLNKIIQRTWISEFVWWTGNKSTDGEKMTVKNFQIVKKMRKKYFNIKTKYKMTLLQLSVWWLVYNSNLSLKIIIRFKIFGFLLRANFFPSFNFNMCIE